MENKKENVLKNKQNSAFTLIELLIVIGIIAILATTVIITVNPAQKLSKARDATILEHLNQLESALYVYKIDNTTFPEDITSTYTEICNTNLDEPDCTDLVDLSSLNLPVLPSDPQASTEYGTGYKVATLDSKIYLYTENGCGNTYTDLRDNNVYPTVRIGDQCWMAKNLAYLPSVVPSATGDTTTPYYYVYGYNGTDTVAAKATTNYQTYGTLYNWPSANISCPIGFHLPTDAEQYILENYLSTGTCDGNRASGTWDCSPAGAKLAGTFSLWTNGTLRNHANFGETGFNALPSGYRSTDGLFYHLGTSTYFWSSSVSSSSAWLRYLHYTESRVNRILGSKAAGFSVRCVRD